MRALRLLAVLAIASGCGGSGATGGGGDGGGGGGSKDGGFIPSDGGVTMMGDEAIITMTPFPVAAGAEVYMCQTFANPFGADAEIAKFHSSMSAGSHHLLVLYDDNAQDGALTPCSGLTFGPMPYGAQQPEAEVAYPDGVAALIKANQGFQLVSHYLNATPNPITANVQVVLTRAAPGTITQHAGVFFFNNISALAPQAGGGVPPMTTKTITASYTTTIPMNVLYALGHMHQRTQSLTATYGGTMLYTSDSWDNSPFQRYDPTVMLPAGTTIQWSCTIVNDTDQTLTFGESAKTNEMCIFDGQYFPVPAGADPSIMVIR
jgi:hypothetical protein